MSKYQSFNGSFFSSNESLVHATNRGFNYGDGFFESIRVSNGKAPFIQLHWERLFNACNILQISIPEVLTFSLFHDHVLMLAQKNDEPNSRVRFQGFRQGSGRYTPHSSVLGYSMMSQPIETAFYELNKNGLKVGLSTKYRINPAPQSSFKSTNAIPYVLASLEAATHGWDDCFLNDSEGFLAEATASNIFLVRGNEIYTPDLTRGGVAGVMRNVVLAEAQELGIRANVGLIGFEDILDSDECFLTNATLGIQWVSAIDRKRFFKKVSSRLVDHINQKFGFIS